MDKGASGPKHVAFMKTMVLIGIGLFVDYYIHNGMSSIK
jgi:hypothetical protein